jgi:hypothetical protein
MILTPRTQKFNSSISTVLHLVLLLLYLLISSCFSLLSLTPSSSTIATSSSLASLLLLDFLYDLTQQPSASPTISNNLSLRSFNPTIIITNDRRVQRMR